MGIFFKALFSHIHKNETIDAISENAYQKIDLPLKQESSIKKRIIDIFPYFFLAFISGLAFIYYFHNGLNLPYADAISRLNISRKIVDNMTPGLAQLGSVWLPLPQLLMLPFIWNDYMWRSGLAGAIMSMSAFIIGGIFVFKSARIISNSYVASILSLFIYALNINLLYLQTTAMSESLFVCLVAMCIYFFLKWLQRDNWRYLVIAGLSVSGITLTRYEGLPILIASVPIILFIIFIKKRKRGKVEGMVLMYFIAAGFGFALWTLYLTLIFGDPLFWLHYYAAPQIIQDGTTIIKTYSQHKPFLSAVWLYFSSVSWMSGIIPVAFAILSLHLVLIDSVRRKNWYFLPMLLPGSVFLFMVLTLQRNTPIIQPDLNLTNILSPTTSLGTGFNIRYGLMIHSWVAILTAYLFGYLKKFRINILIFIIFLAQITTYFYPRYTLIYQIPMRIYGKPYTEVVNWFKKNYAGGPILISAAGFEDQMFQIGLPYKYYIHEGTNKYWKEALDYPARYASYIVVDFNKPDDTLGKELKNKPYWSWFYDVVYNSPNAQIYQVKTKPDLTIPGVPIYHPKPRPPSPFITQEGKNLVVNGKPFIYKEVDLRDIVYEKEKDILLNLDKVSTQSATVVRVWAFGNGIKAGFQPQSYKYNEDALKKLGFVISEAKNRDLFVLLTLENYDNEYGGILQYLKWDGLPISKPENKEAFFTNEFNRNRFREYISHIVSYKNPYTDANLSDDISILGWELINSPQISESFKLKFNTWVSEMSSVVSHYDPHHLIFSGNENIEDLYSSK